MKALSIAAFVISVLALALAVWTYVQADTRLEQRVEQALQQREIALLAKYQPEVERIYDEFGLHWKRNPQNLDDLFRPMFQLFLGLRK